MDAIAVFRTGPILPARGQLHDNCRFVPNILLDLLFYFILFPPCLFSTSGEAAYDDAGDPGGCLWAAAAREERAGCLLPARVGGAGGASDELDPVQDAEVALPTKIAELTDRTATRRRSIENEFVLEKRFSVAFAAAAARKI